MTNAEAIYYLERIKNSYTPFLTEEETAIDMAISALEKQEQKKTLTNADRIRELSDEELARYLIVDVEAEAIRRAGRYLTQGEIEQAVRDCAGWLKQEVKDGY